MVYSLIISSLIISYICMPAYCLLTLIDDVEFMLYFIYSLCISWYLVSVQAQVEASLIKLCFLDTD